MFRRGFVVGALLGSAGLSIAAAAEPPRSSSGPVIEESVEVGIQLVDVVVTGKDGEGLRGLTRENFVVDVGGERQEVLSVDGPPPVAPVPFTGGKEPGALSVAEAETRWIVFVFDADHISSTHRKLALESALGFLRKEVGPNDRVAFARLDGNGLRYLQAFAPPGQLNEEQFADPATILGKGPGFRERMQELVLLVSECAEFSQPVNCVDQVTAEFLARSRQETAGALDLLQGLVAGIAPLPGRKAVVIVSDGLMLEPARVLIDVIERFVPAAVQDLRSRLEDPPQQQFPALLAAATRARVSLFGLLTGGSMGGGLVGAQQTGSYQARATRPALDPFETASKVLKGSLRSASAATGGLALETSTRLGWKGDVLDRISATYTLAIRPLPAELRGRKLKIRLAGVDGKVEAPGQVMAAAGTGPKLGGTVEVLPGRAGAASVRLVLDRAGFRLAWDEASGREEGRAALYYRVVDAGGRQVVDDYVTLRLWSDPADGGRLVLPLELPLAPGKYLFTATVSDMVGHGKVALQAPLEVLTGTAAPASGAAGAS